MSQNAKRQTKKAPNKNLKLFGALLGIIVVAVATAMLIFNPFKSAPKSNTTASTSQVTKSSTKNTYQPSKEEKEYLAKRFADLKAINSEAIAYVYAPGTKLDEPVVQTKDNSTYLDKTFEGGNEPYMGTVFMDTDNKKDFSDRLTWLFGHARGSQVEDHRMFNDVNYYSDQSFFDKHKYVVIETPQRKYYYEALAMVIVPEDTAFYRTSFESDKDFKQQLDIIYDQASVKNKDLKVSASDKYLVLSTCREEDETIRANLYLRQIPDSEMSDFVAKHGKDLEYTPTR